MIVPAVPSRLPSPQELKDQLVHDDRCCRAAANADRSPDKDNMPLRSLTCTANVTLLQASWRRVSQ
jgi:hypothetical protein